jgi:hypothetical protein
MLAWVEIGLDIQGQLVARLGDPDTQLEFAGRGSEIWWEPDASGESGRLCAAVIVDRSWGTCDEAMAGSVASVDVALSITGTSEAWVVDVVDPASGESVGVVRGSTLANDLAATLRTVATGTTDWFVIDGGTAERVEPDWADPNGLYSIPDYTETAGGLLVYDALASISAGETDIWRTTNGRTWERISGDGLREQSRYSVSKIHPSPSGGLVAAEYGPNGEVTVLTSSDGAVWEPASRPPIPPEYPDYTTTGIDPVVRINATERGLVYFTQAGDQLAVWTSPDGDVWDPVDVSTFRSLIDSDSDPFAEGGSSGSAAAGDVVTVSILSNAGPDTRWVLAVE